MRRPKRLTAKTAALAVMALLATVPAPVSAQAHSPQPRPHAGQDANLRAELAELVARPDGPPGVIAVLTTDGRTKVYRAGVAEVGSQRPPRPGDYMRLASASKAYTGAVALSLVRCGLLGLDETLGQRLPHLPAAWASVTLRQLLNHTSGLPDFSGSQAFRDILRADPHHLFDSRRLLDFVAEKPLNFPPGSRYEYSNSDNIAVALMAEAASGRRYEDLLADLVYRPLGLRRTSLPSGFRMYEPYIHGYAVAPNEPPEDVSELIGMSGVWASGAITSTPNETGAFMRAWASGALVGPAEHTEQFQFVDGGASEPAGPGRNDAGLATFRYTTRCGVVYGHTGNTAGYTQLAASTEDGRRSLTFSVSAQINKTSNPALLERMRAIQEDFVCALLTTP
ncbi:serine hydrolase domain-containing protein [Yinghuangia soli]|uniref:Beta-lactamase family protein n=1 Tax=Yinghuangia soli TaxID=2908204 RepID=A0AA41TZT2_9ACTN|nr:serine hydrolase domain-containing protein [Yinghuangia soli]MCF2527836.1 beta-lactamase family protein [Yinghuangia soli]